MRSYEAFILGAITGGVAVWVWGKEITGYLQEQTRGVRTQAAERSTRSKRARSSCSTAAGMPCGAPRRFCRTPRQHVRETLQHRAGRDSPRPVTPRSINRGVCKAGRFTQDLGRIRLT